MKTTDIIEMSKQIGKDFWDNEAKKHIPITPPQEAEEWELFKKGYPKLVHIVERLLQEQKEKFKEAIDRTENFYEYTPKEDMFGVGYERAIDDVRKALKEI
jgi:hypothetical protein